ncbi:hypothetical protein E4U54_004273 [Claviceps lovelessii]|nr:hypothetical protein E4U54_004273 [Claviceps lovelessii]
MDKERALHSIKVPEGANSSTGVTTARLLAASLVISVGVTFCSQLEQKSCNGQKTAVMADDVQRTGEANPKNELVQDESAEDAETRATRRELKQSSISDGPSDEGGDEGKPDMDRPETPSLGVSEMQGNEVQEKISSPKKKRSHDQLEGNQEPQENDNTDAASSESANGRAVGCEPEKKRYREKKSSDTAQESPLLQVTEKIADKNQHGLDTDSEKFPRNVSSTSFAKSAFGQLASETSGFASLQSSERRGFSSAAQKPSSLNPASSTPVSEQSFNPSGIKALQSDKAARPFGAPDSDVGEEDEDEEEDGEGEDSDGQLHDKVRRASPDKDNEDKRRPKLQKIEVDDGEAGEITVLSVRAKMFSLDKQSGWKERGAGMLKINVPHACVEFDDAGAVVPGSFDASGLDTDESSADDDVRNPKVARLILRQDQTHRVILNTAILPAMEFQEKSSLKSVGILFTALEGAKPVSITIRLSAANAKLFLNEITSIQRELRGH